jgi:hypothetical protein
MSDRSAAQLEAERAQAVEALAALIQKTMHAVAPAVIRTTLEETYGAQLTAGRAASALLRVQVELDQERVALRAEVARLHARVAELERELERPGHASVPE